MGGQVYTQEQKNEIINDFLSHDFTQSELARYYDAKYGEKYISSQTISKILNNDNLSEEIKEAIKAKKTQLLLKKTKINTNTDSKELNDLFERMEKEIPLLVINKIFINEENKKVLRIVYLFVTGKSYQEISEILGYSKSTISKWINKAPKLGIFNNHTLHIIENKLQETKKYNDSEFLTNILLVVNMFMNNGGNYELTMKEANISERTLTRYLSYEHLDKMLGEEQYKIFKDLMIRVNKEQTNEAAKIYARNYKIREILNNIESNKTKVTRYKKLLVMILLDKKYDVKELSKLMQLSVETLKKYLQEIDTVRELFGDFIAGELIKVIPKLDGFKEQDDYVINLVNYYLSSRCKLETLAEIFSISINTLTKILRTDVLNYTDVLGENIKERIQQHTKVVSTLNLKCPRNLTIVNRPEMIKIVKDDVLYVTNAQYKSLEYCVKYLQYNGNLKLMCASENLTLSYVYTELNREDILSLLNDEARRCVQFYMKYENIINQNVNIAEKKKLIEQVVYCFCQNKFDVLSVIKQSQLPIEVISLIVNDEVVDALFIKEIISEIRREISCYQTYQNEQLQNKKGYK